MTLPGFDLVEPDDAVYAEIARRIDAHNRALSGWNWTSFSIVLRQGGRIVAAGRGVTNLGTVEIRGLWVDPDRRRMGIGRRLLAAIEAEAARRGCTRAALDSYAFQAPAFYARLGYREWGRLDYPGGVARHFFVKDL
jgi:GNAT superfamily N-acetyltransferase